MTLTDEEKRLLEVSRRLLSPRCRELLIARGEAMCQTQQAILEDFGLTKDSRAVLMKENAFKSQEVQA
jgi:hypothetical protein